MSADDPLDAVIAGYLQQVEAGHVPDREALLARHPEIADRLRAFFADCDRLDRRAGELRLSADPGRTADASGPDGPPPRVRYFGDYELLEVVAQGGMGVVYKARQVSLNRIVALKMILAGHLANAEQVRRFRAEAEEAANLDHPHIVPIYEVGEHEGQQYYAMRFVEGTSLSDHPRADARREAQLVATVARAVHHAHQRGILHRDLKPSNVLVDPSGAPQVADFGLAKRLAGAGRTAGDLTVSGALVGTPRYMAPEQAAGRKDLTVAADVYSLGVVLYERLTGRTPFQGESVLEVLRQVREAEPPRPSALVPRLGRDLETVCLKCLEKDPAKRYGSAEELAEELERWLRGEPIRARHVGQAERAWRWCKRNRAVAALLASVAAALISGSAVSTVFAIKAERKAEDERRERQRAGRAETAAVAARDDLRQALARSLVRPLSQEDWGVDWGHGMSRPGAPPLREPEASALWELSLNPSEGFWSSFVTEATRTPMAASQLRGRAESAWIAAVGLDLDRREWVLKLLTERLSDKSLSVKHRFDLAAAASSLGKSELLDSRETGELLLERLTRMDPVEARGRDVRWAIEVVDRQEPEVAAHNLTQALERVNVADTRKALAEELATVCTRMGPAGARRVSARAAWILCAALEREQDPAARDSLVMGIGFLVSRMERAEAARVSSRVVKTLRLACESDATADEYGRDPVTSLTLMAGLVEPPEAVLVSPRRAVVLLHALEEETIAVRRATRASDLADLAGRMEPAEAARVCRQAAQILTTALGKEPDLSPGRRPRDDTYSATPRSILAGGLVDVSRLMGVGEAVEVLSEALEKESDASACEALAVGLAATAGRMSPAERARALSRAADRLTRVLEEGQTAWHRGHLARGLAAAAGRMERAEAARVASRAVKTLSLALEKEVGTEGCSTLVDGMTPLIPKIEPSEAAGVSSRAATALTRALENDKDVWGFDQTADRLATLFGWMEPAESARVSSRAAAVLTRALEKETTPLPAHRLMGGLGTLTAWMERTEATRVLALAVDKANAGPTLRPPVEPAPADRPAKTAEAKRSARADRATPFDTDRAVSNDLGRVCSLADGLAMLCSISDDTATARESCRTVAFKVC
jgi:tRNA A-37 threonylcarbamoyl transferase component Bud32